eukprot:4554136-Alexandrium_andersonii.AAC.1
MSASLVGSEMCIRDRDSEQWPLHGSNLKLDLASVLLFRDEAQLNLPQVAVSYTHLTLPTICSV